MSKYVNEIVEQHIESLKVIEFNLTKEIQRTEEELTIKRGMLSELQEQRFELGQFLEQGVGSDEEELPVLR